MILIEMAGEPIGKGRHRRSTNRKTGMVFEHPDPKTARFEDRLAWVAQTVMAGRPLLTGALWVRYAAWRSVPASKPQKWRCAALRGEIRPTTKPDVDNLAKTMDALNKVVWIDDAQIVELVASKFYSDRPRVEIRVSDCPPGLFG